METQMAATIYADQTSIAAAQGANQTSTAESNFSPIQAALTADVMTAAARTPVPSPSIEKFNIVVPAGACRMNSEVHVSMG
jgi:hypothetical protein